VKAAVRTRYGPPDVVRIEEVDKPIPKPGELLIRVHASTVNQTDCGIRAARPWLLRPLLGLRKPRLPILGTEFAGEVEAVGAGVSSFKAGDRVFGYDEKRLGGHAEYKTVRAHGNVAKVPAGLTYADIAPTTEGSHYALAFIRTAGIRSGHDVLVNGATGAIGSAAVQILNSLGARVTGTCATEHMKLVADLGAERVIDYTAEDFTKDEHTYDVVLDAVGKSSFGRCRRLLKSGGVYLSSELGPKGQNLLLVLVTPLLGKRSKKVKFPFPRDDQQMVRELAGMVEAGNFKPVIDRVYPLERIVEAYSYVESGQKVGNVVVDIGDG
jgi:NADPH:quinone reductase-like Zn-dependent oxidoreductase